jgi:protein phosphatase
MTYPVGAESARAIRIPSHIDKRGEHGPFDIIGDVHGCADELFELLTGLGYSNDGGFFAHPDGRRAVFLGDLCDRGPRNVDGLRTVMAMVHGGSALCVQGNHDNKLLRWLNGRNVQLWHGLQNTVDELQKQSSGFRAQTAKFLGGLPSHYILDGGALVVTHAGIKEHFIGLDTKRIREFCLYGEITGETDEYGFPVRLNWANDYKGRAMIVYGHTPHPEPVVINNTYCIDTACVFGGKLTALRYPEREFVSIAARRTYSEPGKPLTAAEKQ